MKMITKKLWHVVLLDEWPPEQLGGLGGVLGQEELAAGFYELLFAQKAVVVGVNSLEGGGGHLGGESQDLEEGSVLLLADHAVTVGIYGCEEQGEGALNGGLHAWVAWVLYQGLHGIDEGLLLDGLSTTDSLEVFVPNISDGRLEVSGLGGVEFLRETLGHSLEILTGDSAVLIEVNSVEVGAHLLEPEIRHVCWCCV